MLQDELNLCQEMVVYFLRELRQLTKLDILEKVGVAGRATHYIVAK